MYLSVSTSLFLMACLLMEVNSDAELDTKSPYSPHVGNSSWNGKIPLKIVLDTVDSPGNAPGRNGVVSPGLGPNGRLTNSTTFRCACKGPSAVNDCPSKENFCVTSGKCYSFFKLPKDGSRPHLEKQGCFDINIGYRQCQETPSSVVICCEGNMCNSYLEATNKPVIIEQGQAALGLEVQLLLAVMLPVLVLVVIIPVIIVVCRRQHKRRMRELEARERFLTSDIDILRAEKVGDNSLQELVDVSCTSGSGSGLPFLVQRTVARAVTLHECIGKGRYGEVWKGSYHGEYVAVKVFSSRDEASWKRESEIYNTVLLRHENILGFFASDMTSRNSCTQLWLIMHYHEQGSLYDYLNKHVISKDTALTFAQTAASGLVHLHTEIFGTLGKPGIAHRDIKSKNILVKKNGQCCVADLGLAVMHSQVTNQLDVADNPKVGTKRYMAPELLDGSFTTSIFDSYKNLDVYSFGLVLWEISRCCSYDGLGSSQDYEPPYFDLVPPDPSFDEMYHVVCELNQRPAVPSKWYINETMEKLAQLMKECWTSKASARLTMLRVKKTLAQLRNNLQKVDSESSVCKV